VAYARGEEPENDNWVLDFVSESVYQIWLTRQASLRNAVQRIQHKTPTLT
jgi:hypothetical protein